MRVPAPQSIAVLVLLAGAAFAGSPDDPGQQGDILAGQKAIQQGVYGTKSGWGQAVSDRARNGSGSGARNLGAFLNSRAGGPNPDNDNGKGND